MSNVSNQVSVLTRTLNIKVNQLRAMEARGLTTGLYPSLKSSVEAITQRIKELEASQ